MNAIAPGDLEALYAEKARQRTQAWATRQTNRRTARTQHHTARQHGLTARHTRKLARKAQP